jgi:RHS repeat-associated protein
MDRHTSASDAFGENYSSDANSNMTQRVELSGTQWVSYGQAWDIDNRLIAITSSLGYTSTFFYSADGERVKKLDSNGGWFYIGNTLEKDMMRNVRTTYYYLGSQRVAMRVAPSGPYTGTLRVAWIHGDQLGSASLTTSITGTTVSEMRYFPFGEVRWISGTMPTDKTFTGQRSENQSAVGSLMDFGARFYSPILGRFISADTIVPQPGDPQSLNRFLYAGNSPLNRLDPSGHFDISAFIAGFSDQYVDDLSLGLHSSMNVNVAERMRNDDSAEYNIGRVGGQLGALLFAGTEIGSGGTMAGGSIAAGGGCAVLTLGACAPIGAAVAVGGATVGAGMVGHGLLIAGKVLANGDPLTKVFTQANAGDRSSTNCKLAGTRGLEHSFDEHSSQWFGRSVPKSSHFSQWQSLIERAAQSRETFEWSTGDAKTIAHLARIEDKYFVAQFFAEGDRAGELATAFEPSQDQLSAMLKLLGR